MPTPSIAADSTNPESLEPRIAEMCAGVRIDAADPGEVQPFRPRRAIEQLHDRLVMEKVVPSEIRRSLQRAHREQQARTADDPIARRKQTIGPTAVVLPAAEANEHLGLVFTQVDPRQTRHTPGIACIDGLDRRRHVQLDLGMQGGEAGQVADQPTAAEGWRRRQQQAPARLTPTRAFDRGSEALQSFAHFRQHQPAFARQLHGPRQPPEQLEAEVLLEATNLVADRRRRHRQFGGGVLETQVPGRRLEGAQ
ncbi:MAG: hypothetical protein AW12_01431 [Candidatus Accumulibacter sp. BA-94]|nr:MAG: hypothetical protein AW12_01431 [Candidatus Accumulibacter sp. BA-94]